MLAHDQDVLGDGRSIFRNINDLTKEWNHLTKELHGLSGQTGTVLDNIDGIAKDIREITGDPEIKANVKTVAKNATQLTNAILSLTASDNQFDDSWKVDLRTETLGTAKVAADLSTVPGAQVNFNVFGKLGFDFPLSYFKVGLDEIGDSNLVNLQAGSEIADGTGILRFGLVRGRIGAGTDINLKFLDQPLTLSGEVYDINSPRVRLGVLQNIFGDYGLSMYWDNQFVKGINEFNVGVRWQPGEFTNKETPKPPSSSPLP